MTGSIVFLHLIGAVALLLWASRMVRTGIERAYGNALKNRLRLAVGNRLTAALAGTLFAVALQSATAVALIVSGFVAGGYVSAAAGIAVMLGADLGSAVVVRILRYDLSLLVPVFLVAGTVAFRASHSRRLRQWGRILIGLGLLFLSLRLIGEASAPLRGSTALPAVFDYLSRDWISAFALAALMAWAFHSSVAAVLLVASLSDQALVPESLVLPLVLGINFGAAVTAAVLTRGAASEARAVPLGNLLIRGAGALLALAILLATGADPQILPGAPGEAAVLAHLGFNAAILLLGLPFAPLAARLVAAWLRLSAPPAAEEGPQRISALRPEHLSDPRQALNNATREILTLCDRIELMLDWIFDVFEKPDPARMRRIEELDDEVDRVHNEIKFYLARISLNALDDDMSKTCQDLLSATIKLEQAADVISHNMLARVRKKHARNVGFSAQGWRELQAMHDEVRANARLAFNLIIDPDLDYARQLVAQKEVVRRMVQESEERHLERLRAGNAASHESSSIHIDTIRDVKEFNSLLVSLAYPVLTNAGMLRESRLL